MVIKNGDDEILREYFNYPYGGAVFVYNNVLTYAEVQTVYFHTLLSHKRAFAAPLVSSMAMSIHDAIMRFSPKAKTALDVGSKMGYFAFLLAEDGVTTVAVEPTETSCVIKIIAKLHNLTHKVGVEKCTIQQYIITHEATGGERFDLILMLNIFDHMLRDKRMKIIAWETLLKLSEIGERMVLMMGPADDAPTQGDIPQMVLAHTRYKKYAALLADSYGGRTLWGFEKE